VITVIIDVLRAFTTAAVALAGGADGVVLAGSPADALRISSRLPGALAIKDGGPDPDFDGVNSPVLVGRLDLAGRPVVLCTTAGTVCALAAEPADRLYCASFLVAGATAAQVRAAGGTATFVATGEDGRAEEDLACAEYLAALAGGSAPDPEPFLRRAAGSTAATDLAAGVRRGYRGIHPDDVSACLRLDEYPFAMLAGREEPGLVLRAVIRRPQSTVSWR
jgi:2-phosphosulfolactate phosphatase